MQNYTVCLAVWNWANPIATRYELQAGREPIKTRVCDTTIIHTMTILTQFSPSALLLCRSTANSFMYPCSKLVAYADNLLLYIPVESNADYNRVQEDLTAIGCPTTFLR